ncbi:MAG: hypothetical protein QXG48_04650 [Thermofilaceae archaeon]
MSKSGFYMATRVVNPLLVKLRKLLIDAYGPEVLDSPHAFLVHHDVAIYLELEKLRDALAVDRINKEEFVRGMLASIEKFTNVSPWVREILNELHTALTGHALPQPPTRFGEVSPSVNTSGVDLQTSTCPRCAIEGDRGGKTLKRCAYCGELYCDKHIEPRITMTFNQYQAYLERYRDIAPILREHWTSEGGHPCTAYTRVFWESYQRKRREAVAKAYEVPVKVAGERSRGRYETSEIAGGRLRYRKPHIFSGPRFDVRVNARGVLLVLWIVLAVAYFALPWVIYYGEREITEKGYLGVPIPTGNKTPFEMKVTGFDFAVALLTLSETIRIIGGSWHSLMVLSPILLFAMLLAILARWKWLTVTLGLAMLYLVYDFYANATTIYFLLFSILYGFGSLGTVTLNSAQLGVGFFISTLTLLFMMIFAVLK